MTADHTGYFIMEVIGDCPYGGSSKPVILALDEPEASK